jgi:hypothetical protein
LNRGPSAPKSNIPDFHPLSVSIIPSNINIDCHSHTGFDGAISGLFGGVPVTIG